MFWVNVPVGVFGTLWAYHRLREVGTRSRGRMDWWGNITFAVGLGSLLIAITIGIQPYHGHAMGWTSPEVLALLIGGVVLLVAFAVIETKVAEPMFHLGLFKIRAFAAGNVAGFAARLGQGGLQFMLVIWLQGIWLPLHGYNYSSTPLWAGIFLLPLTAGFLVSGPLSGHLSDRYGARGFATAGMVIYGCSFIGLLLLPVDFDYADFAILIAINGIGIGMFSAPNTSSMMSSVPAEQRGAASGMRATFQNSGTALSIGVFFSLMITGLASTLPKSLTSGLVRQGVPHDVAHHIATLPPVSSLFAAVLGVNPLGHLLAHGRRAGLAAGQGAADPDGPGVLSPPDFGAVQRRPDHRLRRVRRPGLPRRRRLAHPRAAARPGRGARGGVAGGDRGPGGDGEHRGPLRRRRERSGAKMRS